MSDLNEIAANHARMANAVVAGSTEPSERQPQIVGSFEVPSIDAQQHLPRPAVVTFHLAPAFG
ncbi:hypothetical protein [Pseudomonas sp. R5(2019)]|uniref:hypothetical protein n=1 Tax=Pseudomonas sp. R5(2019) TaxID=2697566 RepID=UPI003531AB14